jgi:hypothetical protein
MNTDQQIINTKCAEKEEIIFFAEKVKHYCDLLIAQSENWQEPEAGKQKAES